MSCRHNQQEGCQYQDCYLLTDKDPSTNKFESILNEPDYQNTFYEKRYRTGHKYYRVPQRGKIIDLGFAELCTSDNMKMHSAVMIDKRTGHFVCCADELNDMAGIQTTIESMENIPDVMSFPTGAR